MHAHHLLYAWFASATLAQSIFIDAIPEYSALPVCAENALSEIVRDMASGCGDDSKTTSFSCFCTDSSSQFASIISTQVESDCSTETTTAVSEALGVFSDYCAQGSASTGSNGITG